MDFSEHERPPLRNILKETCKKFGMKEKVACAVLYSKNGI